MIDLAHFPRVALAHLPTPLEELTALGPRLFVKRDDCTGLGLGGNKTRKLEFALGEALARGARTILTSGGIQSNHVRQTAAAAARLGLACHAVVSNPLEGAGEEYEHSGNALLDDLFGAQLHLTSAASIEATVRRLAETLPGPYVVPLGASYGIGALGYVECARELLEQCHARGLEPSHVFLATGSAGTQAGLLAGLRLMGSNAQVVGLAISEDAGAKAAKVRGIVGEVAAVLGVDVPVRKGDIVVLDEWSGPAYGVPTAEGMGAIRRVARAEGVLLDPVYTGKAMAGTLALLEEGRLADVRDPVFLHTGGAPALFAYPEVGRARPGAVAPRNTPN